MLPSHQVLGVPTEENWPGVTDLPDYIPFKLDQASGLSAMWEGHHIWLLLRWFIVSVKPYEWPAPSWNNFFQMSPLLILCRLPTASPMLLDLLKKMLSLDPNLRWVKFIHPLCFLSSIFANTFCADLTDFCRPSAEECLQHPWFREHPVAAPPSALVPKPKRPESPEPEPVGLMDKFLDNKGAA